MLQLLSARLDIHAKGFPAGRNHVSDFNAFLAVWSESAPSTGTAISISWPNGIAVTITDATNNSLSGAANEGIIQCALTPVALNEAY